MSVHPESIHFWLPEGAEKIGHLFPIKDPDYLVEDVMQIRIGDLYIDVGWYPEHDPSGEWEIVLFRDWDHPIESVTTDDIDVVKHAVERFVKLCVSDALIQGE